MSERLTGQAWMEAAPTRAVMAALSAAGGEDCARFVGGCVRNSLMEREVDDVDIATRLLPDEVNAGLTAAGLKHAPTGLAHGTVTAFAEGTPFEITTLRCDVTTDGRNATVAFTDDWREDARRRDFTFNALYADAAGTVFDPVGQGVADALAGRVVFVGEAETRIREDYLRILRFFRFFAWYGRGEPDGAALAACAALKEGMARLSAERILKELLKLLSAPKPAPAVAMMIKSGVMGVFSPEAANLERMKRIAWPDPILRLAALLPDDAHLAKHFAERLRLSNADRDRLMGALATEPPLPQVLDVRSVRRILYDIGPRAYADRLALAGRASEDMTGVAGDWARPDLPIGGDDVTLLGVAKGPKVGELLRQVEAWWIDQDFPESRRAVLRKLSEAVRGEF